MNILNLSSNRLRRIASLKVQIDRLQAKLESLAGYSASPKAAPRKRRKMSAAARKKIAAAARARWAKVKAAKRKHL